MSCLEGFKVGKAAADVAEGEVILEGFLFVLRIALFELHGAHGGEGVVDVVERIEENVDFVVPEAAPLHKGVVFVFAPGHIFFLKLVPLHGALLGGEVRVFVNNMLEFVHRNAEGNEGQRLLKMSKAVFVGGVAEEAFRIRIAELLHGHGVNFRDICAFGIVCHNRLMAHCAVAGKGVSQLVAENLHIEDSVVEAAKHEGCAVFWQVGHVAGVCLAGLVGEVHKLVVDHKVDKFAGFGAEVVVHLLRLFDHVILVADRLRIAVREDEFLVVRHKTVYAYALCLRLIELGAKGNKLTENLLAEGRNLLLTVVASALLKVAQRGEGLVAESLSHFGANLDELVEDFLHFLLVLLVEFGIFLECGLANLAVGVLKVLLNTVEVELFAVELNFGGCHKLLILGFKAALLLHKGNEGVVVLSKITAGGNKVLLAEVGVKFGGKGAFYHRFAEFDEGALDFGKALLNERNFFLVKFVGGVKGVANVRNGYHGLKLGHILVVFENGGFYVGVAFRVSDTLGKLFCLGFGSVKVRADIFQFAKGEIFHIILLPFINSYKNTIQ